MTKYVTYTLSNMTAMELAQVELPEDITRQVVAAMQARLDVEIELAFYGGRKPTPAATVPPARCCCCRGVVHAIGCALAVLT
jgi:hypothetical protein